MNPKTLDTSTIAVAAAENRNPSPFPGIYSVMAIGYVYLAFVTALTILSVRTLVILKREAPWTSAGWIFTILYDCGASDEILTHTHLPLHAPYVALAALIVAFIIAGIRDEPQGDPWWWPSRLALTRAEQRIVKAPR